jgi:hypothetical protein
MTSKKKSKTIGTISKGDQLKMVRAARRAQAITSGVNEIARGTGAWGGDKRQRKRRQRRLVKQETTDFDNNLSETDK